MLKALFATAWSAGKTLAISVPTVADALLDRTTRERCDARLADWSAGIVAHAEIDLVIEGHERLPAHPVIFMSNHESHLDVPVLFVACPPPLRMVAKAELFRIPVWGRAMRESGFISVDRAGDREQARSAMARAAATIRSGVNVWIAPEGTRSRDGRLGKLKRGGFRLALETRTPIVPVILRGTGKLMPPGSLYPQLGGRVTVRFEPMIATDGADEATLMAQVERALSRP